MSVNSHPHKLHKHKKIKKERVIYLAVIAGPIMTLPQLYDIWVRHEKQVSVVSWVAYLVIAVVWLWWGFKHKELPIILVQVAWIALDLLIVIGLMR